MMLSRDEALKRLRQFDAESQPGQLRGIGHNLLAGGEAREIARLCLDGRGVGSADLAQRLDGLPARQRSRVFRSIAPSVGAELDRLWDWLPNQPYQLFWDRRPFRSDRPGDSAEHRGWVLRELVRTISRYPQEVHWHARWAPYTGRDARSLGLLFASEIGHGDIALRGLLTDSAYGRDEIGAMGGHVVIGLLSADDPDGWQVVGELLLKAQRQEGLRQAILEHIDFAAPHAFVRMLDLILEHDLTRFAATVRAAGVWFGESLEVRQGTQIAGHLATVRADLASPPSYDDLARRAPADAYLGLWALAFRDAHHAAATATSLLAARDAGTRLAATRNLAEVKLDAGRAALTPALADPDPRVLAAALTAFPVHTYLPLTTATPLHLAQARNLVGQLERHGKATTQQIGLLGSRETKLTASLIADTLIANSTPLLEPVVSPA